MLRVIVHHVFVKEDEGGVWLLFDPAPGNPIALAIGPFRPASWARHETQKRRLPGVARVPLRLQSAAFLRGTSESMRKKTRR